MTKQTASETFPWHFSALSVQSLAEAALPKDGPISLTYDRHQRRRMHMRDADGHKVYGPVQQAAADIIRSVDELLQPFHVQYMQASLQNFEGWIGQPLDGFRVVCAAQLFHAHACDFELLEGIGIDVRPSMQVVTQGETADIDVGLDVRANAETLADQAKQEALRQFGEWGAGLWSKLVSELLAQWVIDSGISDLRLQGTLVPEQKYGLGRLGRTGAHEPCKPLRVT